MAAITSNAVTGNASAGGSWVGGVAPSDGDTITIVSGAVITQDVNRTYGSKASGVGIGVTINGTSAGSFGTLQVASGVTLTLRGFNTTTNAMMSIARYGLFAPQPGSTVLGDVASDFGSVIINNGRFEAIGSSGSHITISSPAASFNWGSVSDTNSKITSEAVSWAAYDRQALSLIVLPLANPHISNAAKTGLGSLGDTSLVINSTTNPALTGLTEVAYTPSLSAVTSGKYCIDYDAGVFYVYQSNWATTPTLNVTYWKLDLATADWRGWGILSYGSTTSNTFLMDYCDCSYMGTVGSSVTLNAAARRAPINLDGHQSAAAAGDSTRLCYIKRSTFNNCVRWHQYQALTGTLADPIVFSGNTVNDMSGGTLVPAGVQDTSGLASSYVTWDSNAISSRAVVFDVSNSYITGASVLGGHHSNFSITNNTGTCGLTFATGNNAFFAVTEADASFGAKPCTPDLYIAGNDIRGFGDAGTPDGRLLIAIGGTSGHPAIVENNYFHHCHRFGHLQASYATYRKNRFVVAYHHGFTGSSLDDTYCTDTTFENNLFACDRTGTNTSSTSAAIQGGYNHRCVQNNVVISGNTFDGFLYGAYDFGDIPDSNGPTLLQNVAIVNNVVANGKYAFGRFSSAAMMNYPHVLESDFNVIYNQATGYAGGTGTLTGTKPTGFYQSTNKYNRLAAASRNIPGVALFDASYTTVQTGRSLVYTVNTLGQDHTLTWGSGSAVQLIYDFGTASGTGLRTLGCTGKSTWTANINSIKQKLLWVVSGTGAGQVRPITWATANTAIGVTITAGGTFYTVGQYIKLNAGTLDTPAAPAIFKVTSVSGGAITGLSIVSGGAYTVVGGNPIATSRLTTSAGGSATLTVTWAPGLLVVPDFTTALDATSVFAIVTPYVQLGDGASGTVQAGLCPVDPGGQIAGSTTCVWPTTTKTDTGITVVVANSPTSSPGYSATANDATATDYQWTSGAGQDAGTSDNAASTDYFGTTRPQGSSVDIGFFEAIATVNASGSITLGSFAASGAATLSVPAAGSITLASMSAAGTATLKANASGSVTLATMAPAGAMTTRANASGAVTLGSVAVAGATTTKANASGSITLVALAVAGTATTAGALTTASGSVTLGSAIVAGAAGFKASGSGSVALAALSAAGAATAGSAGIVNASGSVTLAALATSAGATFATTAAGGVFLGALAPIGATIQVTTAAGLITLAAASATGTADAAAPGIAFASGSISLAPLSVSGAAEGGGSASLVPVAHVTIQLDTDAFGGPHTTVQL